MNPLWPLGMHLARPRSKVIWWSLCNTSRLPSIPCSSTRWPLSRSPRGRYDAVTAKGDLNWQNGLTELNEPFFKSCDGNICDVSVVYRPKSVISTYRYRFPQASSSTTAGRPILWRPHETAPPTGMWNRTAGNSSRTTPFWFLQCIGSPCQCLCSGHTLAGSWMCTLA